jgi:hypothetical protein
MPPTTMLSRPTGLALLSSASLLLAVFACPPGLQAGWGECYASASAAAHDALSDARDCTIADNEDTTECGTIVYQDEATGCYTYHEAQTGEDGGWPAAGDWVEATRLVGEPVAAIHSHNNPEENGYVLSPWDYELSEDHGIPVLMVAEGADQTCYGYFDAQAGTGEGYCE